MERRGSRTRRQPPSRQARRNGWWQAQPGWLRPVRAGRRGTKNTRVAEDAGAVSGMVGGFLGGSEACVRHAGGAGRGSFCFECRRDDRAHLRPQETSVGAKPNHAFSMCQQFCKIIFSAVPTALPSGMRVASARKRMQIATRRAQRASTFEKCRISCTFVALLSSPSTAFAKHVRIPATLPPRLLPNKQAWK